MDLYHRSIQVILQNQTDSGAYVASPSFPSYTYCWLRDGSFIAYAMDRVGEHGSAKAFFQWVGRTIRRYAWKVDRVLEKLKQGESLDDDDYLQTRYTLNGEEDVSEWGNFQLDGYGTWLWALAEHITITADATLLNEVVDSVQITVRYLSALWMFPNYDCWEEHPEYTHPYTLAAIYAGLKAADSIVTVDGRSSAVVEEIRRFVLERGVQEGQLAKFIAPGLEEAIGWQPSLVASDAVDASLVGVTVPYHLLPPEDPIMQATVARIEAELHCPGSGVHRYLADTYYGGGEWLLLAAWLGWYYAQVGERAQAQELLRWVEAQADANGCLPEQVSTHLLAPDHYAEWEARWGPVANPLLWSHAMYLILHRALQLAVQR